MVSDTLADAVGAREMHLCQLAEVVVGPRHLGGGDHTARNDDGALHAVDIAQQVVVVLVAAAAVLAELDTPAQALLGVLVTIVVDDIVLGMLGIGHSLEAALLVGEADVLPLAAEIGGLARQHVTQCVAYFTE